MPSNAPLYILGGHSVVTPALMRKLTLLGRGAKLVSRRLMMDLPPGFSSLPLPLAQDEAWKAEDAAIVFSLLPLQELTKSLSCFRTARVLVALSGANLFVPDHASYPEEEAARYALLEAEERVMEWGLRNRTAVTLLRPSMIYDGLNDPNIQGLMQFITRFGFVPLAAPAKGKRQPLHADDLADALWSLAHKEEAAYQTLAMGGGEILTYRAMIERVFEKMGRKKRLFLMPPFLLRTLSAAARGLGVLPRGQMMPHHLLRMNDDILYENDPIEALLNLRPRRFLDTRKPLRGPIR